MQNDHNKAIAIALSSENTISDSDTINDVVLMNGNEGAKPKRILGSYLDRPIQRIQTP
ncbi:MAG: hypothetical protein FIO02_11065 [Nitrosopumilales archaeon]|nr:hypothetical protein [Nitrosopumilales archaeon]